MPNLDIETFFNTGNTKRFFCPGRFLWGAGCRSRIMDLIGAEDRVALFIDTALADGEFASMVAEELGSRLILRDVVNSMPVTQHIASIVTTLTDPPSVALSIGGGSTADTAKAVVASLLFGDCDGIGMGARRGAKPLPDRRKPLLIGLPTTAGTGADASRYYVTYDVATRKKVHGKSFHLIAD